MQTRSNTTYIECLSLCSSCDLCVHCAPAFLEHKEHKEPQGAQSFFILQKFVTAFVFSLLLLTSIAVFFAAPANAQVVTVSNGPSSIIKTGTFYSPSVGLQLKYTLILPADYYKEKKRYPVVYLLHGHTGNYTSWITYAQLPTELATQYNCIIILPDGGNSWYVNWTGQTDGKPHRWEDMLVKDLVPAVDRNFRTIATKKGRAIGGLSMGGYGALAVGLKNNNLFQFVFSTAGAINFCKNIKSEMARDTLDWNSPQLWSGGDKIIDAKNFSTQKERTPRGLVFKTASDAGAYDPYLLLAKTDTASLPFIHIDCGNRDELRKDAFQFADSLKAKTTHYSFITFPGEHEVPYWRQSIVHTFLVMEQQGFFFSLNNTISSSKKRQR